MYQGGQSIGASASISVLPMNVQGWFPLGLTSVVSLQSKGLSRVFSNTTIQNINSSVLSLLYDPVLTSIQDYCPVYIEVNLVSGKLPPGPESGTLELEFWGQLTFQIVVLEKTLESPLDCQEIKPVNPK